MQDSTLYTITVPMRDNQGSARPEATKRVQEALCAIAGGYTATIVDGGWQGPGPEHRLYTDNSTRFEVIVKSGQPAWTCQAELKRLAKTVCRLLDQECVLITRLDARGFASDFIAHDRTLAS